MKLSDLRVSSTRAPKSNADEDAAIMARLRAPFGYKFIQSRGISALCDGEWFVHDANGELIVLASTYDEGYARLVARALNEHFEKQTFSEVVLTHARHPKPPSRCYTHAQCRRRLLHTPPCRRRLVP